LIVPLFVADGRQRLSIWLCGRTPASAPLPLPLLFSVLSRPNVPHFRWTSTLKQHFQEAAFPAAAPYRDPRATCGADLPPGCRYDRPAWDLACPPGRVIFPPGYGPLTRPAARQRTRS